MVDKVVGIDPGKDGGLVAVRQPGLVSGAMRMPQAHSKKANGKTRSVVCAEGVAAFLKAEGPDYVIIEDVWSSPQMGVVGAFSFGDSRGVLRGVCAALGLRIMWVAPITWKGRMGVLPPRAGKSKKDHKKALKAASIARAQVLFPGVKGMDHDGVAEAALIASYALLFSRPEGPDLSEWGTPETTTHPRSRKLSRAEVRRTVRR